MRPSLPRSAAVLLAAAATLAALALAAPPGLAQAAGEPPPEVVLRAVERACPGGATYCFDPPHVEVGGGNLTFVLDNGGAKAAHNLCIALPAGGYACAPGPGVGDTAPPGGRAAVTVDLDEPGRYAYWCNVSGHRALGMEGVALVPRTALEDEGEGPEGDPDATPGEAPRDPVAPRGLPGASAAWALLAVLGAAALRNRQGP